MQRFSLLDAAALVRETITQAPGQEMYERFRQLRCTGLRDVGWPEMSDLSTLRSTAAENSASLRKFSSARAAERTHEQRRPENAQYARDIRGRRPSSCRRA